MDDAIIDHAALRDLLEDDRELLEELVEHLLCAVPAYLAHVRRAVAEQDAAQLNYHAHRLRGSLSNLCSRLGPATAAELEAMGRAGCLTAAPEVLSRLEGEVQLFLTALPALRGLEL